MRESFSAIVCHGDKPFILSVLWLYLLFFNASILALFSLFYIWSPNFKNFHSILFLVLVESLMFLDEKVKKCADLQPGFNQTAEALPKTDFVDYLLEKFGDKATASAVLDAFEKMGIPAPESRDEFMDGAAGVLVFLNRYGLVIRIEHEYLGRINDSPWVLKPIASIDADEAIFEICP
ncbi:MAG: hypothetical protein KAI61_04820, partial [Alphaproteobacteria bacterium]|nr:hypothetical protein [Alphaproteobacteria bacterium]